MKSLYVIFLFSSAAWLMGCHASVSGGGADPGFLNLPTGGNSSAVQTTCTDFTGKYQMNSQGFSVNQMGCVRLTADASAYGGSTTTYVTDNAEHLISDEGSVKKYRTAYFEGQTFVSKDRKVNADGSSVLTRRVMSFSTTPCDLANPDGTNYLMIKVYRDNSTTESACDFWAPNHN